MKVMKIMDNIEEFFHMIVMTMLLVMNLLRMGGYDDNNMSHNRYDDTVHNREKYKPMFSVMAGKSKGAGHKKRKLRKLCDTDHEDNAGENHEVLERPRRKNSAENKQPAKVSQQRWVRKKGRKAKRKEKSGRSAA